MIRTIFNRITWRGAAWAALLIASVVVRVKVLRWLDARIDAAVALAVARDPEREALEKLTVVLDAGHGGMDTGTSGNSVQEKIATLDLTRRVQRQLLKLGVRVQMTRENDTYVELAERCALAAKAKADAMVSIHLNASSAKNVSGIETYYSSKRRSEGVAPGRFRAVSSAPVEDRRAELLAASIQRQSCRATRAADRGVRDSRLYVVLHASCPAALVECGYLTNADEARRLKTEAYKEQLAAGIADGVRHYLLTTAFNPRRGFSQDADGEVAAAGGP